MNNFSGIEMFFLICAVVGGIFVLIRLVMQFVGVGSDMDPGMDVDAGVDSHHTDSDVGFKLLSLHGFTSFLMMFGLVGFALHNQNQAGTIISLGGAIAAGLGSVWVIRKMFSAIGKLQSSGTVRLDSAVGSEGKVYLTIPEKGIGKVLIHFRNRLREFDASSERSETIKTGEQIRVVKVNGNVMVVEKI